MADNKKKQPKRELPLGDRQKQYALAVILRQKDTFLDVKANLTTADFDSPGNRGYALVWATVNDFYNVHNELPSYEVMCSEVESRLALTDDVDDASVDALNEFLDAAYSVPEEELDKKVALSYVRRMIHEQTQYSLLQDIQLGIVNDMPSMLNSAMNRLESASLLTTGAIPLPFPENAEDIKPLILEKTGISFLDSYMNGGMARKEVNGFCGPYGSCKTTLGVMLAVERARHCIKEWRLNGCVGQPERVYFFSWEEDVDALRPRFLSYAACIARESLEGPDFLARLSRTSENNLKPYENRIFQNRISQGIIEGEFDRMQNAMKELNLSLRIIDFSGADPTMFELSSNLVQGMVSAIERDQVPSHRPGVALVVADYAGAMAERAITAGKARREDLRHIVGKMPQHLKNLLAAPLNCQVWCLHQLGTEANSRDAGVAPKSTDAAEARNFFENVNFGFMVGKPNKQGMTVLTNGKQRRAARKDDSVLHIDGALSRVRDVSAQYMIADNTIVSRSDANQIVREDMVERRSSRNNRGDLDDIGLQ